ncbi:MAG TPA: hypothetical protein VFA48_04145 [Gammaproteobacteria bacterium]|nr:hypothetical protein [Gammaproteobacteria bacterium]
MRKTEKLAKQLEDLKAQMRDAERRERESMSRLVERSARRSGFIAYALEHELRGEEVEHLFRQAMEATEPDTSEPAGAAAGSRSTDSALASMPASTGGAHERGGE